MIKVTINNYCNCYICNQYKKTYVSSFYTTEDKGYQTVCEECFEKIISIEKNINCDFFICLLCSNKFHLKDNVKFKLYKYTETNCCKKCYKSTMKKIKEEVILDDIMEF